MNIVEEIHFLLFLTVLFLGIQLAIYIFYLYLKIKAEQLQLNKNLFYIGFIQVLIGISLSILSVLFIFKVIGDFGILGFIYITLFISSTILLLVGGVFSLIGLYELPTFYKFKWEGENLLKLFIINQKNNVCLYSNDFAKTKSEDKQKDYKKLFSVGIIGIDSILSLITNTRGEKINKIKQDDSFVLLEYGSGITSQIIYALVVKKESKNDISVLKIIRKQFETFYKELLTELETIKGSEELLFGSFDIILKNIIY